MAILTSASVVPIITMGSQNVTLPPSLVLLGGGAKWAAGNGSSALFVNWKDNWVAHHLTDGVTWGPWPSESTMDTWRFSISYTLEQSGFKVDFAGDIPESLSDYDLVVIFAYWAIEPQHEPLIRDYIFNGGSVVILAGAPCHFTVYCKDWWIYKLGGDDLTSIQEWFGCRHYINAGGYADVIVDNPFGTPLLTGDTLLVAKSHSCAAVTSLNNDTQVIAQWRSGPVFAFTHEYGKGRVYYQAAFDYALTHDLAVALDAPSGLEPGGSSLLDATVTNEGMNNETDVDLFLLVDGAVVDSATIPELLTDSSYTLSYLWIPAVEGSYNITAYASPVSGENITTNNVVSKIVDVRERSVVYVDPETTTARLGETFVVEIKVAKVADLYGHEFKVFWDTALLDCVGSTINRIWYPNDYVVKDEILENYDAAHGRYWCAYLAYGPGEPPFNGDTTLVSLTFEATGLGTSALDLYDVTLVNSEAEAIEDWQSKDSPHDGYVTIQESTELDADVNSDGIVDIVDLVTCALAFGSKPGDDNWDPRADVANEFGLIDIVDLVMIAIHFGETQ